MSEQLNEGAMRENSKRDSTISISTLASSSSSSSCSSSSASSSSITATLSMRPDVVPLRTSEKPEQVQVASAGHDDARSRKRDSKKWWRRTRIHVALLGLMIAAVNCYAQATFCISIVEMVLPADYVSPQESTSRIGSSSATTTSANNDTHRTEEAAQEAGVDNLFNRDQSCPIEFKYRDLYDSWRFPETRDTNFQQRNASGRPATGGSVQAQQAQLASGLSVDLSNRFDWDASQQGLLLGAFAIGTAPLQIVGGRLAEIYGAKWVLLMGCIGTGLTNLTIPYLAHFSFVLLLVNRVLMGVAQAGMEPGLMCLLADWLTPQEAGFFISMLLFAICLGFFLGSLCSGSILALSYGWPLTFYVSGGLNLLVALIWYAYADSWPRASKYISEEELRFIEEEQGQAAATATAAATTTTANAQKDLNQPSDISDLLKRPQQQVVTARASDDDETTAAAAAAAAGSSTLKLKEGAALHSELSSAPWRDILASPPVWAFIICKISIRWCADVLSNELPTYLANVLHLSIKVNGLLNSVSAALFAISSFLTGWLATSALCLGSSSSSEGNAERSRRELSRSKTRLRKSFQSVASFGSALCLVLMTQFDCDLLVSMSMLLVLSCCLVMGTGGELQIPYDMTTRYPGTLHGLACTLSVSGWLAPPLIGLILGDQPSSRARWSIVWYSTAAINLLGGLMFVLFADAAPRDFDKSSRAKADKAGEAERAAAAAREGHSHEAPGGYVNDGLSGGSSCESSPRLAASSQAQNKQSVKTLSPLDASLALFDCGTLNKCRQTESSFIQARAFQLASCASNRHLDSPLYHDNDPIWPYREESADRSANKEEGQQGRGRGSLVSKKRQKTKTRASSRGRPLCFRLFAAAGAKRTHHDEPEPRGQQSAAALISGTISTAPPDTNEKFMPNERAAAAVAPIEPPEPIKHSSGSHDRRRPPLTNGAAILTTTTKHQQQLVGQEDKSIELVVDSDAAGLRAPSGGLLAASADCAEQKGRLPIDKATAAVAEALDAKEQPTGADQQQQQHQPKQPKQLKSPLLADQARQNNTVTHL